MGGCRYWWHGYLVYGPYNLFETSVRLQNGLDGSFIPFHFRTELNEIIEIVFAIVLLLIQFHSSMHWKEQGMGSKIYIGMVYIMSDIGVVVSPAVVFFSSSFCAFSFSLFQPFHISNSWEKRCLSSIVLHFGKVG